MLETQGLLSCQCESLMLMLTHLLFPSKDWPPSADFRTTFPELYDEFNKVVPAPSYSRRDGAFNIASHFPSGTIAPDLGSLLLS